MPGRKRSRRRAARWCGRSSPFRAAGVSTSAIRRGTSWRGSRRATDQPLGFVRQHSVWPLVCFSRGGDGENVMNRKMLIALAGVAVALPLAGCVSDGYYDGPVGPGPVAYDGFYDDYYG